MSANNHRILDVRSRQQWRNWLREHHDSRSEIWLVFHKLYTPEKSISYDEAVEEALCFGWIDSAKRDETKRKRLREAISLLTAGKKLGLE